MHGWPMTTFVCANFAFSVIKHSNHIIHGAGSMLWVSTVWQSIYTLQAVGGLQLASQASRTDPYNKLWWRNILYCPDSNITYKLKI